MRSYLRWFVVLPWVALLPAQRTIVVDAANGTGTHFLDVPPAYAAASTGDTILIRTGAYTTPAAPMSKAITVLGAPHAVLCFPAPLRFAGIASGARLVLGNLALICGQSRGALEVADCPGTVHVEGLRAAEVTVRRCAVVTFAGSEIRHALIEDATVSLVASCVCHGAGQHPSGYALEARNARVTVGQSHIVGPGGAWTPFPCGVLQPPQAGASLVNSTLVTGRTSVISGGVLNGRPTCNILVYGDAVHGVNAQIEHDVQTLFVGAENGSIIRVVRTMPSTWAVGASPGTTLQVRGFAPPGEPFVTLASLPVPPIPTPYNDLWIDPNPSADLLLGAGLVDGNGRIVIDIALPVSVPFALPITVQSGHLSAGRLVLSNAATVLLYTSG